LEDLSLKKKEIRLRTVQRTFGIFDDHINNVKKLNEKELEQKYADLDELVTVIRQNVYDVRDAIHSDGKTIDIEIGLICRDQKWANDV